MTNPSPSPQPTPRVSVPLLLAGFVLVAAAALIGFLVGRGDDNARQTTPSVSTTTVAAPSTPPPATVEVGECDPSDRGVNLEPRCGILLGTTDRRVDNLDLSVQEQTLGRNFDMVRIYKVGPTETFFAPEELSLAEAGRTLVYSWKVINEPGAWARVASGEFDDQLRRAANEIVASGQPAMFSLHHEPEDNVPTSGSNADYVAMMRHAHEVMEPIGGEQLIWFINYRGHSFGPYDQVEAMYPGDDVIDWISWNPYNWFGCQGDADWTEFASQARPFYTWAQAEHPSKPLMIGETATNEDPDDPNRKALWIADMGAALVDEYPRVKAVLWFHQSSATNFCDRRWDSSQPSIEAFTEMASSDYFGG